MVYFSNYRETYLISYIKPFLVNSGYIQTVDLHYIIVLGEISVNAHKLNSTPFHPVLFSY
jgi:hypothetical protein